MSLSSNSVVIKETFLLSSLFLGSVYMTVASLKEINKFVASDKYNFIVFTLNWSMFFTGSILSFTAVENMCEKLLKHKP